jgi:ribulose-phosphate 3-epimerase
VLQAGATCLIAGTAVYGAPDYAAAIAALHMALPQPPALPAGGG